MPEKAVDGVPLIKVSGAGREVRAQLARAVKEGGRALDILDSFLRTHLEYLAANPEAGRVLYAASVRDAAGKTGPKRGRTGRSHLAALEKIFASAKEEKSLRGDIDPAMAAVHFLGVIQMAWTFWIIGGRRGDLLDSGSSLFAQLWAGVGIGRLKGLPDGDSEKSPKPQGARKPA